MSHAAQQSSTVAPLERALRERLGLLMYPLTRLPQSENRETARVVINSKQCADQVFGVIRGKERTYREVYERVYGTPLVGGPL